MRCERHPHYLVPYLDIADSSHSYREYIVRFSLKNMLALEGLTLRQIPPDEMLPLLDGRREIGLQDRYMNVYKSELLLNIAPRLTVIWTNDCFTEQRREQLAECVQLKELETTLTNGSECAFGEALRRLPELRRLTLRWQRTPWDRFPSPHAEAKDVAKKIVANAPRVEKFSLRDVRISESEIGAVLRSAGNTLRELEFDLGHQNEGPLKVLETMLWLVLAHCPELRQLKFPYLAIDFRFKMSEEPSQWDSRIGNVERVLAVVTRRVPLLDVSDVEKVLAAALCTRRELMISASG